MNDKGKAGSLTTVLALSLVAMGGRVPAAETGAYQAPDLRKFLLMTEEDGDGDGDGIKETHILHYQNVAGDKVFSMTTNRSLDAE